MSKRLLGICLLLCISTALFSDGAKGETKGQRIEEEALRTVDTRTFRNPDGTRTLEIYSAPQHFRDKNGKWQAISTRVSQGAKDLGNGIGRYGLWNEDNLVRSYFPDNASRPVWFITDEGSVGLKPVCEKQPQGKASAHGTQYSGIWEDADLVYTVRPGGVKEDIVLSKPNTIEKYRFELLLKGLTPSLRKDTGVIAFRDARGQLALEMPAPFMYEMKNPNKTGPVSMRLVQDKNDDFYIELLPDREWLASPDRSFPVVIDPTVIYGSISRSEQKKRHYFFQTTADGPITWNVSVTTSYSWITAEAQPYLKIGTTYEGTDVLNKVAPLNLEQWSDGETTEVKPAGDYHVTLFGGSWTFIFSGYGTATLSLTYTRAADVPDDHLYPYNRSLSTGQDMSSTFSVASAQTMTGTSTLETGTGASFQILDGTTVLYSHTQAGTQTISLSLQADKTYTVKASYGTSKVSVGTNHYEYRHIDVDATLNFPSYTKLMEKQIRIQTSPGRITSTFTSPSDQNVWLFGGVASAALALTDVASGVTRSRGGAYDQCDIAFKQAVVKDSDYRIQLSRSVRYWSETVEMERPTGATYTVDNDYSEDVGEVLECKLLMAPNKVPTVSTTWPAANGYAPASANFKITTNDPDWSATNRKYKTVLFEFATLTGTIEHTITQTNVSIPVGDVYTIPINLSSWTGYVNGAVRQWRARVFDGFTWTTTPYSQFTVDSVFPTLGAIASYDTAAGNLKVSWQTQDAHLAAISTTFADGVESRTIPLDRTATEYTYTGCRFDKPYSVSVTVSDEAGNTTVATVQSIYLYAPEVGETIHGDTTNGYPSTLVFTRTNSSVYQIKRYKKDNGQYLLEWDRSIDSSSLRSGTRTLSDGTLVLTWEYGDTVSSHSTYQYVISAGNGREGASGGPDQFVFTSGDISVQNGAPVISGLQSAEYIGESLRVIVSATDPDNDALQYNYKLSWISSEGVNVNLKVIHVLT